MSTTLDPPKTLIAEVEAPPADVSLLLQGDDLAGGLFLWTREKYHRLADKGILDPDSRVELLDGKIWKISSQRRPHFRTIRTVADALETAFGEGYDVQQLAPIVLNDTTEPEPDVAVVTGQWADYADHPSSQVVMLVVEVSDSTLAKDRTLKAQSYARAGITDYWIVNLVNRQLEVYRDPTPEGVYLSVQFLLPPKSITPLHALTAQIHVADLLPPIPSQL